MTPSDLQTLLRDDRWMRRVARGLLRDPNDVEDAVQEAWVADLEGGSARLGSRRGWLRGVLWNRASGALRRERVLRERALDGARERAEALAPSAADDAAAREAQRVVAEALLDLDEDLRVTVHLTYLADLSTREVAARTGVSPTAVRKRLARAHAELRRRLDAEHDGDRRTWALALTPFLRPDPAPLAAAAAHRTEPRLAMRQPELLAAAAVVVTAVASFSFMTSEGGPTTSTETRSVEMTSAGLSEVSPALAPSARSTPSRRAALSPAAASSLALIRGRLETPDGDPLGVGGWVLRTLGNDPLEDAGEIGAGGLLEVPVDPLDGTTYRLCIESSGFSTEVFEFRSLRRGVTLDLGLIRMRPESVLRCRLVDEAGVPVVDPTLAVRLDDDQIYVGGWRGSFQARSTADPETGEVVFRGLGPAVYTANPYVRGAGSIEGALVQVGRGEEVVREFVLTNGSEPTSEPSGGRAVRIRLTPRRPGLSSGTADPMYVDAIDASGASLEVTAPPGPGRDLRISGAFEPPVSLSIADPRFEPIQRDGIEPGDVVRARLDGTSSIRLDVTDEAGEAVHTYAVRVEPAHGHARSGVDVHDGATPLLEGRVDGLYAGVEMRVVVSTATHRGEALVEDAPAGAVTNVPLTLLPLTSVHGTVTYPDGEPAAFVEVTLARPAEVDDSPESRFLPLYASTGDPENCRRAVAVGKTDALGRFSIERPSPGEYLLRAASGGGAVGWSDPVDVEESPVVVEFEVPRGASVVGVLDLPDWIDPRDLFVLAVARSGGSNWRDAAKARIDSAGTFRIDDLPAGTIDFELRINRGMVSSAGPPAIASVALEPGEVRSLECDTSAAMPGEIRLTAEGADEFPDLWYLGRSYAGGVEGHGWWLWGGAPSRAREVGPFLVEPGRWTFASSGPDWAELEGSTVVVAPGSRSFATVGVGDGLHRSAITVRRGDGPVASESVRIAPADGTASASGFHFVTDELGLLNVALPEGEVRVVVDALPGQGGGSATLMWPPENGAVIELE